MKSRHLNPTVLNYKRVRQRRIHIDTDFTSILNRATFPRTSAGCEEPSAQVWFGISLTPTATGYTTSGENNTST